MPLGPPRMDSSRRWTSVLPASRSVPARRRGQGTVERAGGPRGHGGAAWGDSSYDNPIDPPRRSRRPPTSGARRPPPAQAESARTAEVARRTVLKQSNADALRPGRARSLLGRGTRESETYGSETHLAASVMDARNIN